MPLSAEKFTPFEKQFLLDPGRREYLTTGHQVAPWLQLPIRSWVLSDLFHQVTRLSSLTMIYYDMKVIHLGSHISRSRGHKQGVSTLPLQLAMWSYGEFLMTSWWRRNCSSLNHGWINSVFGHKLKIKGSLKPHLGVTLKSTGEWNSSQWVHFALGILLCGKVSGPELEHIETHVSAECLDQLDRHLKEEIL